ncbi:DUF4265 domain-containing protein [Streptomyces sp. NPDC087228]|uniref:DUF4265 domain-containing protein n=1 Tax=Streptomyces sp. NPDC087228 TaxID=3365772 RepID=UPI0037FA9737
MNAKNYIVHDDPAIMSTNQYIAMVDLAAFGFVNQMEQVWLGAEGDGSYEVLCIPFRVYGLSLHDIVELDLDEDIVSEVVRRGGHRTMRALIGPGVSADGIAEISTAINSFTEVSGFLSEWSGNRHVAIDIPAGGDPRDLQEFFVRQREAERIYWEWSDVKPFVR